MKYSTGGQEDREEVELDRDYPYNYTVILYRSIRDKDSERIEFDIYATYASSIPKLDALLRKLNLKPSDSRWKILYAGKHYSTIWRGEYSPKAIQVLSRYDDFYDPKLRPAPRDNPTGIKDIMKSILFEGFPLLLKNKK